MQSAAYVVFKNDERQASISFYVELHIGYYPSPTEMIVFTVLIHEVWYILIQEATFIILALYAMQDIEVNVIFT